MKITVRLFGRFREFSPNAELVLDLPGIATVGDFRDAFDAWARLHWRGYETALLRSAAIATDTALLHASSPLPTDGRLAVLPPVSGG